MVVIHTGLTGDSESGWDWQTNGRHLGKVGTFASEDALHILITLGYVVTLGVFTECKHTFLIRHFCSFKRAAKMQQADR